MLQNLSKKKHLLMGLAKNQQFQFIGLNKKYPLLLCLNKKTTSSVVGTEVSVLPSTV